MNIAPIQQSWDHSLNNVQAQISLFNDKLCTQSFTPDDTESFLTGITDEITRLKDLRDRLDKENEKLSSGCLALSDKKVSYTACLCFLSLAMVWAGAAFEQYGVPYEKKIGHALSAFGSVAVTCATIYADKVASRSEHLRQLASFNDRGIQDAEQLKKFLENLKKINKGKEKFDGDYSHSSSKSEELNKSVPKANEEDPAYAFEDEEKSLERENSEEIAWKIARTPTFHSRGNHRRTFTSFEQKFKENTLTTLDIEADDDRYDRMETARCCIQIYKELPLKYQNAEAYSVIVSIAARFLNLDQIKVGLRQLSESGILIKNLDESQNDQLPQLVFTENYGIDSPSRPVILVGESAAGSEEQDLSQGQLRKNYELQWKRYNQLIEKKLKLIDPVEFIETSDGKRLTRLGLMITAKNSPLRKPSEILVKSDGIEEIRIQILEAAV